MFATFMSVFTISNLQTYTILCQSVPGIDTFLCANLSAAKTNPISSCHRRNGKSTQLVPQLANTNPRSRTTFSNQQISRTIPHPAKTSTTTVGTGVVTTCQFSESGIPRKTYRVHFRPLQRTTSTLWNGPISRTASHNCSTDMTQ